MRAEHYGAWKADAVELPVFHFEHSLPCRDVDASGKPAAYPDDPFFLLGNDAFNCFIRASGRTTLLSGTHGWARLNAGEQPNAGVNAATLQAGDQRHELIGFDAAVAERAFGIGFARFAYNPLDGIEIERVLACPPGPCDGEAGGFLTRIILRNSDDAARAFTYVESVGLCYCLNTQQRKPQEQRPVRYPVAVETGEDHAQVRFAVLADNPVHLDMASVSSPYHTDPPVVSLRLLCGGAKVLVIPVDDTHVQVGIEISSSLEPGESLMLAWWTGFRHSGERDAALPKVSEFTSGIPFRNAWRERIPAFAEESDPDLRRELQWHVGCLEAMTQRSGAYGEVFIPQGCSYDYDLGVVASARDLLQHGLAALVYRPALAKSILRHCMKKMTPTGEVRLIEEGGAATSHWFFFTSDQQLYFFYLMAEYLRYTGDASILSEAVEYYPPGMGSIADGLTRLEQALGFIVHEVKTGENGLLRLLCSDWNDCVYFFLKDKAYPDIYQGAESTLNAAMAVFVGESLADALESIETADMTRRHRQRLLIQALRQLAVGQRTALERVWEGRDFLPRVLLPGGVVWGGDDLFLEPQVFTLLDKAMPLEAKQALWQEIRSRVVEAEPLAARQREAPPDFDHYKSGNRENGGMWYALNGPLIVALADFAESDARNLLTRMTLAHHASTFPDQWPGIWSSSDNLESGLRTTAGMPDPESIWSNMPIYCAHPHAWTLYAWERLKSVAKKPILK